jgi:hypothetical protein
MSRACVSALIKSEFFRAALCGNGDKKCERVVNWDGGGDIGCNDDIFRFDMYFPPVKCG